MLCTPSVVTVEVTVNPDSIAKFNECQPVESYETVTIESFNKPASLGEFNLACTERCDIKYSTARPWMNLPMGSYEQLRAIFDWENSPVDHISTINYILEKRYSSSEIGTVGYDSLVETYCEEGSEWVNSYLRSGVHDQDEWRARKSTEIIENLDSAMAKSDGFTGTVYRGMKLLVKDYLQFTDGKSIHFDNFVSCSLAPIMFNHGIAECRHLNFNESTSPVVLKDNDTR